jgi:hypothetical protein
VGVALMVELWPSMCKALSSNPSITKKKKKKLFECVLFLILFQEFSQYCFSQFSQTWGRRGWQNRPHFRMSKVI